MRAAGCEVLGHIFHYETLEARHDAIDGAKRAASRTSMAAEATSALNTLVEFCFKDKDESVRLQAVLAAGKLRLCEALGPLMPLLQDASPLIVEATISSIGLLDWSRFLNSGESVMMQGPVIKPLKSGRARCLLLTDKKRLFYVEASNLEAKDLHFGVEQTSDKTPQVMPTRPARTFHVMKCASPSLTIRWCLGDATSSQEEQIQGASRHQHGARVGGGRQGGRRRRQQAPQQVARMATPFGDRCPAAL